MRLDSVQINNFRNIEDLSLSPNSKLNIFVGANGSGKSSILEAIHYLGFARSFRTIKHKNVIQRDKERFTVFAQVVSEQNIKKLGFSRAIDDSCMVSVDGQRSKLAVDMVSHLPVQIFTPQSSDLVLGSPRLRRKYYDWLMFHVEHDFAQNYSNYRRCLLQLNAIYKRSLKFSDEVHNNYWLQNLVKFGEQLTEKRESLIMGDFLQSLHKNLAEFLPEFSFEISYYKGWEKGLSFSDSINKNFDKDKKNGFVGVGPHKSDLRIKVDGVLAQEILSRGQIRMLVAAMQIAQTQYLFERVGKSVVFLLDDIGAELDTIKQKLFIDSLLSTGSQLFVTAIDKMQLSYISQYEDKKLFHVEQGQVREEI